MPKILINGDFLCRRLTGIERYAYEITQRLDKLTDPKELAIAVPSNALNVPSYKNIEIIYLGKLKSHLLWQMTTLQFFLLCHKNYMLIDYGNTCLPFSPGITFLHDIYCEAFPGDFSGLRDRLICVYNRLQYRLIAWRAKEIITVSGFSKSQIAGFFHVEPERITVIYNGWEHFLPLVPDYSVFKTFPELAEKEYFFSLGSLSRRKNLKWILEYAKKNPRSLFAVSGTSLSVLKTNEIGELNSSKNIKMLGYLEDPQVKALMEKCKAFIMPSYYEGFGIPPLEALSCGVPVIVSNSASLPEIYGNTAHYIDPDNTDTDIDALLCEPVDSPDVLLKKYTYDSGAEKLYSIIKKYSAA
jgi:glycosyltransferase involved in cell wall biosynthesis